MDILSIYKARQTVVRMLSKRGYGNFGSSILEETIQQFKQKYVYSNHPDREMLTILASKQQNSIIVLFIDDNGFKLSECETKVNAIWEANRENYSTNAEYFKLHWILVYKAPITQKLKHQVADWMVNVKKLRIELFAEHELLFDVTEHVDIPRHQRLNRTQAMELVQRLKIGTDASAVQKLPKLRKDDMIARFYDFDKGDVVEIKKHSPIMGETLFYRVVV